MPRNSREQGAALAAHHPFPGQVVHDERGDGMANRMSQTRIATNKVGGWMAMAQCSTEFMPSMRTAALVSEPWRYSTSAA